MFQTCSPAEMACVKFYHPERTSGQLLRLCRGDECTCAEGEWTWLCRRPDFWRTGRALPRASLGCALTLFLLCALENCSMQKKGNISNDDRTEKACETQQFSKIDYGNRWLRFESGRVDKRTSAPVTSETLPFTVYKVRLQDVTKSLSTDVYTVRVLDVIKEGAHRF